MKKFLFILLLLVLFSPVFYSTADDSLVDNGLIDNGFIDNGFIDNGFIDNGFIDNGSVGNGLASNGSGSLSGVRVYRVGSQAITSGVSTRVQFNAKTFDLLDEFDTTTYRFTAKQSGYYSFYASLYWENTADLKRHLMLLNKNGASNTQGQYTTSGTGSFTNNISGIIYLAIDDYLDITCFQDTGVSRNIGGISSGTYWAIWKIDEIGGNGVPVVWGDITGTLSDQEDLQTALDNLNMDKYFQLIQNATTGAEFYVQKTMSYGEGLVVFFLTLFLVVLICSIIFNFFWKK